MPSLSLICFGLYAVFSNNSIGLILRASLHTLGAFPGRGGSQRILEPREITDMKFNELPVPVWGRRDFLAGDLVRAYDFFQQMIKTDGAHIQLQSELMIPLITHLTAKINDGVDKMKAGTDLQNSPAAKTISAVGDYYGRVGSALNELLSTADPMVTNFVDHVNKESAAPTAAANGVDQGDLPTAQQQLIDKVSSISSMFSAWKSDAERDAEKALQDHAIATGRNDDDVSEARRMRQQLHSTVASHGERSR